MANDFKVTAMGERAQEFEAIFGSATVLVVSPLPEWAALDGKGDALVFKLDLQALTPEQRERLVKHLAAKFGATEEEVNAQLDAHGLPIHAEQVITTVENAQKWIPYGDYHPDLDDDWEDPDWQDDEDDETR